MDQISSIDQLGNHIRLPFSPERIVSLVPSQTELLFDLGLDEQIVGITRFCIHPRDKVGTKEKIGGTKQFNIERIKSLHPDLIIGNKEENYEEGICALQKDFPVWMSDIYSLDDAYEMMYKVACLVNRKSEGENLKEKVRLSFQKLTPVSPPFKTAAYFIWRKPYMVAAANTFIHHMLGMLGVRNIFGSLSRYPEVKLSSLTEHKPDYIFLSSEPYSFTEKHFDEFQSFSPDSKVILVNGEMFSWYGSRLQYAPGYFESLRGKINLHTS